MSPYIASRLSTRSSHYLGDPFHLSQHSIQLRKLECGFALHSNRRTAPMVGEQSFPCKFGNRIDILSVGPDQNKLNRNTKMRRTSLNRAAIEEANKSDLSARATTEMNRGLPVGKERSFRHISRKGLLVASLSLLLAPTLGLSQAGSTSINLLSPKNGGQVVVAASDAWLKTIDGNESRGMELRRDESAVYAFKNERPATFDTFAVLIPGTLDKNLKEFELLAGDSPTGEFSSIGKFTTANAKFLKHPYQEFKFPPVTAKYLRLQLLSNWGYFNENSIVVFQFRLFGRLNE
jgi:hypothetical protein